MRQTFLDDYRKSNRESTSTCYKTSGQHLAGPLRVRVQLDMAGYWAWAPSCQGHLRSQDPLRPPWFAHLVLCSRRVSTQLFFFTFGSPSPPKTQSGLPACTPIAHLLPDPSCILLVARGAQQLTARQPFRTYIGEPSQTFGAKARPTHPQASKQRPRTRAPSDQHNPSRMEALLETRPFQIYFVTLSGYTCFA